MYKLGFVLSLMFVATFYFFQPAQMEEQLQNRTPAFLAERSYPPLKLEIDHRYQYRFNREVAIEVGSAIENTSYGGMFYVDVISAKNSLYFIRATMNVDHSNELQNVSVEANIDQQGRFKSLFRVKNLNDSTQLGFIKDILSQWSFFSVADTAGAYTAKFENVNERKWQKTKMQYSSEALDLLESEHTLILDNGFPKQIKGQDRTQGSEEIFATLKYELTFEKKFPFKTVPSSQLIAEKLEIQGESTKSYSSLSFFEVQSLLTKPWNAKDFAQIVTYLKSNPDKISELVNRLEKHSPSGGVFEQLVGALASSGTIEAQSMLKQIFENQSAQGQQIVLTAMTLMPSALSRESFEWLAETYSNHVDSETSSAALLAIGASLDHSKSEETKSFLVDTWKSAGSVREKVAVLDALGNSPQKDWLEIFDQAFLDSSRDVRIASVRALRNYTPTESASQISLALKDSDPDVVQASLDVLEQ
jgi:hypothetical protein